MFEWWRQKNAQETDRLESILSSVETLNKSLLASETSAQKALRRLSLTQKQQGETLEAVAQQSAALQSALTERYGLSITYEQMLQTLDNLGKIKLAAVNAESSRNLLVSLVAQATQDLLSAYGLVALVSLGAPYPKQGCEVVGAVEQPGWLPGTIIEVLQQGYQTEQGNLVRNAKVIVTKEMATATIADTAANTTITEFEEIDYVD